MNSRSKTRKKISIVSPCFNEEENVDYCANEVQELFESELKNYDLEHIFIDNASTDNTMVRLTALANQRDEIKVIENARNFGPFASTFHAQKYCTGDAIVVALAADLQDPPEVIPKFIKLWEEGYEVVNGVRFEREENYILKSLRRIYYRLVHRWSAVNLPLDSGEFQLLDKKVHRELLKHEDYYPYVRGLVANCGFKTTEVRYTWRMRQKGVSWNNWYRLLDQAINGIISFTNIPIRLVSLLGIIVSGMSFTYMGVILFNTLFGSSDAPPGIPSIIVIVSFLGGVQLLGIGVLGEYISATHSQVRKRPLVVERQRLNLNDENSDDDNS